MAEQFCIIRCRSPKEKGLPQSIKKYESVSLFKREDAEWLFGDDQNIEIIPCKIERVDRSAKHFRFSPIKE